MKKILFAAMLALLLALPGSASAFLFFGCIEASKGIVKMTKKIALGIKSLFIRKEAAK